MSCSDAALVDYWARELAPEDERALEEHVFACAACARRLGELEALATALRARVVAGKLRWSVPASLVEALAARGLRIRTYRVPDGATVPCGAAEDDELLVARMPVEVGGEGRVDVLVCDDAWRELDRESDVPVDRARREVVVTERVDLARAGPASVLRLKVVEVGPAGERELGRFALDHDPRGPPEAR